MSGKSDSRLNEITVCRKIEGQYTQDCYLPCVRKLKLELNMQLQCLRWTLIWFGFFVHLFLKAEK